MASVVPDEASYRRDIEGLRAVAVLLVVAFHYQVPGFQAGFVGVDVFFVISGYLITGILAREVQVTGSISLLGFYGRRAKRLLPALLLVTVFTLAASALLLAPSEVKTVAKSAFAASSYVSNLWFAAQASDYFAPESAANPLLHTWSLSAEEQFYLLWPTLILLVGRTRRHLLGPVVAAVTVLSFTACVVLVQIQQPLAFYSPVTRAWEFGVGALACLSAGRIARGWHAVAGAILLLVSAVAIDDKASTFPGLVTLLPVVGTAMLLLGGERSNRLSSWLSSGPLVWIGKLSYSIYLWHWPIIVIAGLAWPSGGVITRVACAASTLLCAAASFYLLEDRIRKSSWAANRRRALSLGLGLTAAGMVSATVAWGSANLLARDPQQLAMALVATESSLLHTDPRDCIAPLLEENPRRCDFLNGEGLVVLIGDSHAAQWFTPVMEYAKAHRMKLTTFIKSSCAVSDVPVFSIRLRRGSDECVQWRAKLLRELAQLKPDIVIIGQFSAAYLRSDVTAEQWAVGLDRTVSALTSSAKRVIVLSDSPAMGFNVPACLARPTTQSACNRALDQAVAVRLLEREEASVRQAGAAYVHVTDLFCAGAVCPARRGSSILYRDANHISEAYARELTDVLVHRISGAARASPPPRP